MGSSKEKLEPNEVIALMDVYLKEWMRRDQLMWTQLFKYFYVIFIVILLPNINFTEFHISLPVPACVFRILGLLLSVLLLYIAFALQKRLAAVGHTYAKVYQKLDSQYHRDKIKPFPGGKYANPRIGFLISLLMPALLILTDFLLW